jgi:hypothetical protein
MDVASDLWPPESEVARTVLRVIDGDGEPAPGERTAALRERANGDGENHLGLVVGDPVEPSRPRGAPHG